MRSNIEWFNNARFGMFIHWGAYSVAGRGEWVRNRENISQDEYIEKYVGQFHAENYDPGEWIKVAQDAGMKYVVLTARHHDGFCLWDTKTTTFNAANIGPKRDLIRPFVEAVREAGIGVGLYYSVADWHHPDYPDAYARDWPESWPDESARIRFVEYYFSQLQELMSNYGKIDLLWYDGCIPEPMNGADVNSWIKSVQPDILINNRNGQPCDFWVSEQAIRPPSDLNMPWEACLTLNDNWGYQAGDIHYKSPKDVVMALTQTAEHAGNLLINVGPKSDGVIPQESIDILKQVGRWLRQREEFLSNSSRSPYSWNNWGRLTTKSNNVFLHIFHSPGDQICLAEIKNKVVAAELLTNGNWSLLNFDQNDDKLYIYGISVPLTDPISTTVRLTIEGSPTALREKGAFWIPG